jgi:hypothetical protein
MTSKTSRFVMEDPEELRKSRFSKQTGYTTEYGRRLFEKFLHTRSLTADGLDSGSLNDELSSFYAAVRKDDGEQMTAGSLSSIR